MKKNKLGFTFLEILVAATIIGVLATIGIISFSSASKKARDGKREADMEQIRSALEMYKSDNGVYPGGLGSLTSDYIREIPEAPANSSPSTYYGGYDRTSATTYDLCQTMEITGSYECVHNP